MEGSIAVPMISDNFLSGTLGIAKRNPYDFTEEEVNEIMKIGMGISKAMASEKINEDSLDAV